MFLITYVVCLLSTFVSVHAHERLASKQRPIQAVGESKDTFDASFDAFVEDLLKECHVPGLSIAVVDNGKITAKGYGYATLPDQKATPDTQYFTASTTKAFTAAAAALLVHDDANYPSVHWSSPINSVLREDFVLEGEWATNHITIEDALSHRTGLPGHDLIYGQAGDTVSKVIQRLRYVPMTAEPRVEWQYCNVMYGVVTDLIQTITGRTLEAVLKAWIWEPLGMRSTTFTVPPTDDSRSRLARGYFWDPNTTENLHAGSNDDGHYVPERHVDLLCTAGDGATISTVNDYALWMKALINAAGEQGSWNTSSPISRTLFRDLVTPRAIVPVFGQPDASETFVPPLYALGWLTTTFRGHHLLAHSGGITGFGTELFMLPGLKYGVVTMQNRLSLGEDDAGQITAVRLVLEKLGLYDDAGIDDGLEVQKSLDGISKSVRRPLAARQRHRSSMFKSALLEEALPLPLPLSDFAGLYSHPAYGTFNLTLNYASPSSPPASPSQVIEGIFHPRTNIEKEVFTYISGTLFKVQSFEPHGLGDIFTGEGIVWEELGDDDWEAYAMFEFGPDGQSIESLGIELEPFMIEHARGKGSSAWREGMVWFGRG